MKMKYETTKGEVEKFGERQTKHIYIWTEMKK